MTDDLNSDRKRRITPVQRVLSSRPVTGLGMFLAKHAPPPIGRTIAYAVAGLINRLKPDVYWMVYANLHQVLGPQVGKRAMHRTVRQVFRNTARNNYELWHMVGQGPQALDAAVHIPDEVWERLDEVQQRGQGIIVGGVHTGNFDAGLVALATKGQDTQVLGLAAPPGGGFDLMDHMRTSMGVHVTSIGVPALREAIRRLRAGGIVLTGVDRPVSDEEHWTEFFGRPAPLPTGHVRLALKAGAAIFVAGTQRDAQGINVVGISPPLEMIRTGDADEDLWVNMRRAAVWLEEFIRIRPDQWGMFVPVWPEPRG
jgi:lauroyl/myristoyl acyltransferase